MPEPFEALAERLLRGGAAPAHVRRYLRELSEHVSDLMGEELEAGRSATEAEAAARARLGGDEALAEAMLAQPSLRSWTGRAPWATLVVGPFLLLILAWFAPVMLVLLVMFPTLRLHPGALPPAWLPPVDEALFNLVQFGGPLVIACGIALLAARQRTPGIWPVLGCAAVALFGDSLHWVAHWPTGAPHDPRSHEMSFSLGFRGAHDPFLRDAAFSFAAWSHGLPLVALSLAVAAAVYWMARRQTPAVA